MATDFEYISQLDRLYPEQNVQDVVKGARTDEEAKYLLQKALFGLDDEGNVNRPLNEKAAEITKGWPQREEQISVPFTTNVLKDLGYNMDKEHIDDSFEQFIKDYPRKRKTMARVLEGKPYGSSGYAEKILQNAFRQALKDQAQIDVQKARDDAMSFDWKDPYSIYASAIGHTLLRNTYKAGLEGRDPTLADLASDAAEDIVFAVPGGAYARGLKLVKLGELGKGGTYAARLLGESVAPALNETAQYGLHSSDALEETGINPYDEDTFHDQERTADATFSPERIGLGALTNNAVGIGMYREGAKAAPVITGEVSRGAGTKAVKQSVMGEKTAGELVKGAEEVTKNTKNFTAKKGFEAFLSGNARELDKQAINDAVGILKFKEKAGSFTLPKSIPEYQNNMDGYITALLDHNNVVGGERELFKQTLTKYPQLATLVKSESKKVKAKRLYNSAVSNTGAARAEVVNKYGTDKDASIASNMLGIGTPVMKDLTEGLNERLLENRRAAENRQLMANPELTDTDRKYLQEIIDNPKKLKFSNDTGFKLWLVTRGNDLIRGTSYFRPAFAVEGEE